MNIKSLILLLGGLVAGVSACYLPLPVATGYLTLNSRAIGLLGLFVGILVVLIGVKLGRTTQSRFLRGWLYFVPALLILSFFTIGRFELVPVSPLLSLSFLVVSLFSFGLYLTFQSRIAASGLLGLLVTLAMIGALENGLRAVPDRLLVSELVNVPPLTRPDKGNYALQKNGFRGKRPCVDCPDNEIRIFTMGGSSTYGVPMFHAGDSYAAGLQRLLDERRPGERYEVFNAGVAGYGIVQIIDSLKEEVLKHKPDIVTICSWFNDTTPGPGWYGIPGKSDIEAYRMVRVLRWIENLPLFPTILNSRLYGLFRFYLVRLKEVVPIAPSQTQKELRRPRMNAEEFRWGLEQIVELGRQHDFLPVFIPEPLNRTSKFENAKKRNKYYRFTEAIAAEHGVPVVDVLTPMAKRKQDWLFYDFIHPNQEGHRIIASEIFNTLFYEEGTSWSKAFWKSRGISRDLLRVQREYFYQLDSRELSGRTLHISGRLPYGEGLAGSLDIHLNGELVKIVDGLSDELTTFSVPVAAVPKAFPISDLKVRATLQRVGDQEKYLIGKTERSFPGHLRVISGGKPYGWTSKVLLNGTDVGVGGRGYNVVVLGGRSGEVKLSTHFDSYLKSNKDVALLDYLGDLDQFEEQGHAPVVILSVKTDGYHNIDHAALKRAFEAIGGSGRIPESFHSFALVGVLGAEPGTALEESGPRLIEIQLGDPLHKKKSLLELASLNVDEGDALL